MNVPVLSAAKIVVIADNRNGVQLEVHGNPESEAYKIAKEIIMAVQEQWMDPDGDSVEANDAV